MLASLRSSMLGKGITCLSASQFDSLLQEPQMFNQSTSPNQLFIYKFKIGSQEIKSLDLSRMMHTLKYIQDREEETGKVLDTRSMISMQVISINDPSSDGRWKKRVDTYTKHSEKFNYNIPLMGYYERQSDGGMTRTLYMPSLPFVEEVHESQNRAIDLIQNWYLFKYNRDLSRLNNVKSVEELLESGSDLLFSDLNCIVKLFNDLANTLSELHSKGLTHNSILPRNITMLHTEGGYEFLTTIPSFGLDNNVDGVNDDHVSYFSPQVFSRFEEGVEEVFTTQNDVHMLGTLMMRILLGEEFDAKQIDSDYFESEIGDFKKTITARLGKISTGSMIEILTDLACRCISPIEDSRPTIGEIVEIITPLVIQSYGAIDLSNSTRKRSSSITFGRNQEAEFSALDVDNDDYEYDESDDEDEIYLARTLEEEEIIPIQNIQAESVIKPIGARFPPPPPAQSSLPPPPPQSDSLIESNQPMLSPGMRGGGISKEANSSESFIVKSKEVLHPPSRTSVVSMSPPVQPLKRAEFDRLSPKPTVKTISSSSSSMVPSNKASSFTSSAITSSSFQSYSPKPNMMIAASSSAQDEIKQVEDEMIMASLNAMEKEESIFETNQEEEKRKEIVSSQVSRRRKQAKQPEEKDEELVEKIAKKKKLTRKLEQKKMDAPSQPVEKNIMPKSSYADVDYSYSAGMTLDDKLDRSEKMSVQAESFARKSKKSSFSFSWRDFLSFFSFLSRIFGGTKAKSEAIEPTGPIVGNNDLTDVLNETKSPIVTVVSTPTVDDSLQKKERYIVQKRLSDGASAIILQVKDKDTGDIHVMKRFREGVESDYTREVKCLKLFSHKNIVQFVDNFSYTETTDGKSVKSNIVIMEYCTFGDLFKISMSFTTGKPKPMRPLRMLKFTLQLFEAIAHIHEHGYVHSDVKPQNIFLAKDGTLKLGDFGFTVNEKDTIAGGTLHYLPVEQEEGQPAVLASDLYSAACSMFEVLVKKKVSLKSKQGAPTSFEEIWDQHNKNNIHFHRKKYNPHAMGLFEIFKNCLETDYTKRRSAKDIVETLRGLLQNHSATMVQKRYRGYHARKSFKK